MNVRTRLTPFRTLLILGLTLPVWLASDLSGQGPAPSLTVLAREPRRPIPLTSAGTQELVALDDLAATFQTTVREEGGAITMSYKGRTIVLTPDQTLASVAGRVISLPAPLSRVNGRWMVPVDFISRALAGIYDTRIELRRPSRLVVLGDLRVPRLSIRHELSGAGARVVIDMLPRAAATATRDQGDRLTLHFDSDALDVAFPTGQVPGFVLGYRSIDATTIAIDLGPRVGTFRSVVQVADASSSLVIDLMPPDNSPFPVTTQAEPAPAPAPASPAELPSLLAGRAGLRTIVIDAGHGGDDRGAIGAKGTAEKDVTLAMARHLKTDIESRLGLRVLLTRDGDQLVGVSDRAALANNNKADLFISLHANGALRPATIGATIYVAEFPEGSVDPRAGAAERLPAYGGGLRDIELVPWNLAQARHRDQSEVLASMIATTFRDRIPMSPAPVDHAPLRVLESANMPALLIETGFLTNPDQERLLANADFQTTLAQAIVDAIVRYRGASGEAP